MTIEAITSLISTVGFPIVAVIICGYFIYKITQTYRDDLNKQLEKAAEREERLYLQLGEFGTTLNNFNETLTRIDVRLEALEQKNKKNGEA